MCHLYHICAISYPNRFYHSSTFIVYFSVARCKAFPSSLDHWIAQTVTTSHQYILLLIRFSLFTTTHLKLDVNTSRSSIRLETQDVQKNIRNDPSKNIVRFGRNDDHDWHLAKWFHIDRSLQSLYWLRLEDKSKQWFDPITDQYVRQSAQIRRLFVSSITAGRGCWRRLKAITSFSLWPHNVDSDVSSFPSGREIRVCLGSYPCFLMFIRISSNLA